MYSTILFFLLRSQKQVNLFCRWQVGIIAMEKWIFQVPEAL